MENKEQLTPGINNQSDESPAEKSLDSTEPTNESQQLAPDNTHESAAKTDSEKPRKARSSKKPSAQLAPDELNPEERKVEEKPEVEPEPEMKAGVEAEGETKAAAGEKLEKKVEAEAEAEVEKEPEMKAGVEAEGETKAAAGEKLEKKVEAEAEAEVDEKPDDDEDDDEAEEELSERYGKFNREELVEVLEALVREEDVNQIRSHIGYIKVAFRKLLKEEGEANYEKRLQKEDDHEDPVEEIVDTLSVRFDEALQVYREKKSIYDQALEQQKQANLELKEKILEDLRNLIESEEELKKTYDHFRELQEQWRTIGAVPQGSKSTLWNNYHFLVEKFFDKVKINKELKDLDLKKNLEAKTELCEKAEELLLETSITKSFQQLQKFHEAWKETGPVPKDKKDEIWERFKSATEKLNKRRQDYYDNLREDQNKNYSAKLILCEKAEELAAISPETPRQWQKVTEQVNELFKMWKTIGFAPKKVNNEVWNRFRSSLDAFYKNKKEYFKKYKEHQTENYNQKLNLCLQAEALKENEDWRSTTEELISLQKEWKKIGPVPAKFSDKIWKRFRAACDEFFHNKAEHFSNIGEKQEENLKKKLDLIERVKTHPYTDDNTANLKVLKDFQREWMDIGHVPIKQKDKVQNEFRKTIDEQFDKLNISKKAKSTMSFRSKVDNIKNAPNADNLIYKERNFIINKINSIHSDIKIWENNIGFFASSKKADILKAEFEEKIEKGRQEIAIMEEKLKILRES